MLEVAKAMLAGEDKERLEQELKKDQPLPETAPVVTKFCYQLALLSAIRPDLINAKGLNP